MENEIQIIIDIDKEIGEILDTLTKDYGMSTECLSHLLGVKSDGHKVEVPTGLAERSSFGNLISMLDNIPTQYVLDFMIDSSTVPIEIKYKLASVIMTLRLIFKTVEPKI
jgi:hypothetical protein